MNKIPLLGDLQAAWLLLLYCASPRCNYLLRLLPPATTSEFARSHDAAIARCLGRLLFGEAHAGLPDLAIRRAQLSLQQGGLGLRSAERLAPAAFWASWADALPVLQARTPALAERLARELDAGPSSVVDSAWHATAAAAQLREEGCACLPQWSALLSGAASGTAAEDEPPERGDWLKGWQRTVAAPRDQTEQEGLYHDIDSPSRALLLSQAGPLAGRTFTVLPTSTERDIDSAEFRVLLLRRLRLPIPLSTRRCRCGAQLDPWGDHRTACSNAGVLGRRGWPLERMAARVCREARARVATDVLLRDLNVPLQRADGRRLEVIANGLPLWNGAQVAVDTTLVSPVRRDGQPRGQAATVPGVALREAERDKARTYPELTAGGRCRLQVIALEVGGRWSASARNFLRLLARARAREAPAGLRNATRQAFTQRWGGMLAVAAQRALAASLLELPPQDVPGVDGALPDLSEVLDEGRWEFPPAVSRLPGPG